jgi:hypothetical protein
MRRRTGQPQRLGWAAMKRALLIAVGQFCLATSSAYALADIVTLKDGSQIVGLVVSGGTREIQVKVGEGLQTVSVDQIQSIQFDTPGVAEITPAQTQTLPAGTSISIRTIDAINSKTADEDKDYAASVDDPVVVAGVTVIPAKTPAFLRVKVTKPHMLSFPPKSASLALHLVAFNINGRRVEVITNADQQKADSHSARDAAVGAGSGALIGLLAGGGWAALAGAVIGGGGGYVFDKITGHVRIPSEYKVTYKLPQPLVLSAQGGAQ